jgi:hypothetical protein
MDNHQAATWGGDFYCFACGSFCGGTAAKCNCCRAHKKAAALEAEAAAELAEAAALEAQPQRGPATAAEDEQFARAQDDEQGGSAGSDSR